MTLKKEMDWPLCEKKPPPLLEVKHLIQFIRASERAIGK